MAMMPWMMLGIYGVIIAIVLLVRIVKGRQRNLKFLPMIIGITVALGAILFVRSRNNDFFLDFQRDASSLTLSYYWPKASSVVPLASIDSIAVVRGRRFYKKSRSDDRAWLKIKSGSTTYSSCDTAGIESITSVGRSLAASVGKELVWQERCPDPDNRAVPATEAQVTAPGRMEIPAACASAAPPGKP
jgi:hypothetical protein